ncbi:hypothetical protein K1W69_17510 [Hoeflea sp. WL0058]|uniref:Uncharacterized protein n=1 Tax=Flavimaribacter sediminis TaxID=2865987 RepID=A0AAE2ZRA5_9HYPH|nr:hypothetical protein [Flavimaribacter sediminis]MBW8638998.1 hypothetical protein [Flavimaribacter sediminis]
MNGAALLAEHRRLDSQAKTHKREADRHRKAARAARAKQAEIEARCKALGIAVTFSPGEGDIHGRHGNAGSAA